MNNYGFLDTVGNDNDSFSSQTGNQNNTRTIQFSDYSLTDAKQTGHLNNAYSSQNGGYHQNLITQTGHQNFTNINQTN